MDKNNKINKVLITGITGFVGSHLADYILENFPEVKILGLTEKEERERGPIIFPSIPISGVGLLGEEHGSIMM